MRNLNLFTFLIISVLITPILACSPVCSVNEIQSNGIPFYCDDDTLKEGEISENINEKELALLFVPERISIFYSKNGGAEKHLCNMAVHDQYYIQILTPGEYVIKATYYYHQDVNGSYSLYYKNAGRVRAVEYAKSKEISLHFSAEPGHKYLVLSDINKSVKGLWSSGIVDMTDYFNSFLMTYSIFRDEYKLFEYLDSITSIENMELLDPKNPAYFSAVRPIFKYNLAKGSLRNSPLHLSNSVVISEILLDKGFDVNAKNSRAETPLHFNHSFNTYMAEFLIENKADINAEDMDGNTVLHKSFDMETVRLLIEKGADINIRNNNGDTPLVFTKKMKTNINSMINNYISDLKKSADSHLELTYRESKDFKKLIKFNSAIIDEKIDYLNKNGGK